MWAVRLGHAVGPMKVGTWAQSVLVGKGRFRLVGRLHGAVGFGCFGHAEPSHMVGCTASLAGAMRVARIPCAIQLRSLAATTSGGGVVTGRHVGIPSGVLALGSWKVHSGQW